MKKDPIVIFVALFLTALMALALAKVAKAGEADSLAAQLGSMNDEYKQIEAHRAELKKKAEELKWAGEQLAPKIPAIKAEDAQLATFAENYERKVAVHNSRCSGTFEDEGFVQACNGEKDQLDAEKAHYEQQHRYFEERWNLLKQALEEHDSQVTLNNFEDQKAYNREIELHNMAIPIINRLHQIAQGNDECKNAITNADMETMHRVCGKMFDGNR